MAELGEGAKRTDFKIELLVIFAILVSLGFPGNFTEIYGDRLGSVMEYAAFAIEILAMLLSSGKSWLDIRIINLDKKYWILYLFVAVIFVESMIVTGYPSQQFITCMRLAVTLLFVIWLQEQFHFERMIELICIAQTIFVLFTLLFMLRYPGYAFTSGSTYIDALKGLYSTKNGCASELFFGILVMSFLVREKRKKMESSNLWMVVLLVQVVLLIMCQATGAILGLFVALVPLFLPEHIRLPLGWIYIGVNIFFLFAVLTLMPYFEWFFDAIGKDATLTGRVPLWNQIISVMENHNTFTGFGYSMFWRDPKAISLVQAGFGEHSYFATAASGAHNMLLELWLNIGLLGIAMFFAALLYVTRDITKIPEKHYLFSSVIMIYQMICGLTERNISGSYSYKVWGLFLFMALCCNRPDGEEKVLFPQMREV